MNQPTIETFQNDIKLHLNEFDTDPDEINDSTHVEDIVPVIRIRDAIFAVKGDISIVGGLPKAGKTSISAFMLATALMKEISGKDSLGIATTYCEGKEVIYIDTEQPRSYTNRLRKTVINLIDSNSQPSNLKILNLRKYSSDQKKEKVLALMNKWPNAHLWIIDGVADLIKDPNDTKEAFGIIETFMVASDTMNSAIILHIHENPGTSGKLRGNLGSEAERKCGAAIAVKKHKDKGVHSIEAKVIRGSGDFDPIYFRYDRNLDRMVSVSETESVLLRESTDKAQIKQGRLKQLAKRCLVLGRLKSKDLVQSIMDNVLEIEGKGVSKRTAENRLSQMKNAGLISLDGDYYELVDIPKQ